jgi:hypothetical protein
VKWALVAAALVAAAVVALAALVMGNAGTSATAGDEPANRQGEARENPASVDQPAVLGEVPPAEAIELDPPGPYERRQRISISVPTGWAHDWMGVRPQLCAVVGPPLEPDVVEYCHPPENWTDPGAPVVGDDGRDRRWVLVEDRVLTPGGWRMCSHEAVACRFMVRSASGDVHASAAVEVRERPDRPAELVAEVGVEPESYEVTVQRGDSDRQWLDVRIADPTFSEAGRALLHICSFSPEMAGGSEALPDPGVGAPLVLDPNCRQIAAVADHEAEHLIVHVPSDLTGQAGPLNCAVLGCYMHVVVLNTRHFADYSDMHEVGDWLAVVPGSPETSDPTTGVTRGDEG